MTCRSKVGMEAQGSGAQRTGWEKTRHSHRNRLSTNAPPGLRVPSPSSTSHFHIALRTHPSAAPSKRSSSARRGASLLCALILSSGWSAQALAQARDVTDDEPEAEEIEQAFEEEEEVVAESVGGTVTTRGTPDPGTDPGAASSTVTQQELQERLPRSAPDALRYEPGVFVQQTAHSQASAFIRGRTGQQTILAFDDVRLNNSLFRQGPNQYFFTIDARTIQKIDITRGSASTRHGTDAIAGTINATPISPTIDPTQEQFTRLSPRLLYRLGTADDERGGRVELGAQLGKRVAILSGVGSRNVGQLESGGKIYNPSNGELPQVPRFADDGRTQLGTGFDEVTADTRLLLALAPSLTLTLAAYTYRQYDAPRTDQCPPAYAPFDECLQYDEQFRDLLYLKLDGDWGKLARRSRFIVSQQRQHEERSYQRPGAQAVNRGEDNVTTTGVLWKAQSEPFRPSRSLRLTLRHGFDYYRDAVTSTAETELQNLDKVFEASRGQYLTGSSYGWGGVWVEPELLLWQRLVVRLGGRLSHITASAPADEESGTLGVRKSWTPVVGNIGLEYWLSPVVTLLANADQGFRAPNLDDLTSRQRTGPGFQIENASLNPERGVTYEAGVLLRTARIEASAWGYVSTLEDAMIRTTRDIDACPPNTPECRTTWSRLQLVNLPGEAVIYGAELGIKAQLTDQIAATTTASYARGDGPTPLIQADDAMRQTGDRVPLSRIPPLNGTLDLVWRGPTGIYTGGALRWARLQDRLAISDVSDERIPLGGTPGFAVVDLRAGYRHDSAKGVHILLENLFDQAYRYHGSSTNGPGRSLTLQAEIGW